MFRFLALLLALVATNALTIAPLTPRAVCSSRGALTDVSMMAKKSYKKKGYMERLNAGEVGSGWPGRAAAKAKRDADAAKEEARIAAEKAAEAAAAAAEAAEAEAPAEEAAAE